MRCQSMCISAAAAARSSIFRAHAETNRLTRSQCPACREVPSARSRRPVAISAIMPSASTVTAASQSPLALFTLMSRGFRTGGREMPCREDGRAPGSTNGGIATAFPISADS